MKKTLLTLMVAAIIIVAPVTTNAISLAEVVDLFISLGIIPQDKVEMARDAVSNIADNDSSGNGAVARDGDIAVREEFDDAIRQNVREAFELFIQRHPDHELAERARAHMERLRAAIQECPTFHRNLWLGLRGDDVSNLQKYLTQTGDYTYGEVTGFFGPATLQAVQRWQAHNDVVSSGDPDSTGYGLVGPRTRRTINAACTKQIDGISYGPGLGIDLGSSVIVCAVPSYCDNSRGFEDTPDECVDGRTTTAGEFNEWYDIWQDQPIRHLNKPKFLHQGSCANNPTADAPVIHSFSGPKTLGVNETGTWRIRASDPKNGRLTYNIYWGDISGMIPITPGNASNRVTQNTVFDHAYSSAGTYTITVIVSGSAGNTTRTTNTVRVGNIDTPPHDDDFSTYPTSGRAPLAVKFTAEGFAGTWTDPNTGSTVAMEDMGMRYIDFGDGSEHHKIICKSPTSSKCTYKAKHTYERPGTYTAILFTAGYYGIQNDDQYGTRDDVARIQINVKEPIACTKEYVPVCAQPPFHCPGDMYCAQVMPAPKTYSNKCLMEAADAEFLYEGKCKEDPVVACTVEWAPVCALDLDFLTMAKCAFGDTTCGHKTYSNMCSLNSAGAKFLYNGECKKDRPTTSEIPENCKVWYDGCNTCSRAEAGAPMACTLTACILEDGTSPASERAYCREYFEDATSDANPNVANLITSLEALLKAIDEKLAR